MERLHVYLNSDDRLFSFQPEDFSHFQLAHPEVALIFLQSEAELMNALPDIEYLDTWFFENDWFKRAQNLKEIFTPAAGKDYVQTHPDVVVRFGTFHGQLMAETTLGLILNFSLRLPEFRKQQETYVWQRLPLKLLRNQTAIILGYGSIGQVCGELLNRLGMKVIGVKRQPATKTAGEVELISVTDLQQRLPEADHIVSFLPGGTSTESFISKELLKLMSPEAHFYNLGRGTTVDEEALLAALQNHELAGAALDVTEIEPLPSESGLWTHPRVQILPHTSAYFEEYRSAHVTELTDIISSLKQMK